jgi:apolipoprotein N-acyltransferase
MLDHRPVLARLISLLGGVAIFAAAAFIFVGIAVSLREMGNFANVWLFGFVLVVAFGIALFFGISSYRATRRRLRRSPGTNP